MIQRFHRAGATFAVTLGLAMLVPTAFAQSQPPANQPQQPPASAPATQSTGPTPNDTELKNFAHAAVDVENIRKSMQPKLAAAKTADARTQVKQAAEKQMEAAVKQNDLSLQRYVQIANVVQTNSTIRAKVQKFMPPLPPQASSKS